MEGDPKNLFEVKNLTKYKGNGVISKQELEPGQEIICEEAAIIGPASADSCLECLDVTQGEKSATQNCNNF